MNDLDNLRVPAWCPLCEGMMRGSKSTWAYYEFGCCMDCFIEFVDTREDRWRGGWRPSAEELAAFRGKNGR